MAYEDDEDDDYVEQEEVDPPEPPEPEEEPAPPPPEPEPEPEQKPYQVAAAGTGIATDATYVPPAPPKPPPGWTVHEEPVAAAAPEADGTKPPPGWTAYDPEADAAAKSATEDAERPRGMTERITEGWKGGFGTHPVGDPQLFARNPTWLPFSPLVAGVDAAMRAPMGVIGAGAGFVAGALERNPKAMLPYGISPQAADRTQREVTDIGKAGMAFLGAKAPMYDPFMGVRPRHVPPPEPPPNTAGVRNQAWTGPPAADIPPAAPPAQPPLPLGPRETPYPYDVRAGGERLNPREVLRKEDLAQRWEDLTPKERAEYNALNERDPSAAAPGPPRPQIGGGEAQPGLPLDEPVAPKRPGASVQPDLPFEQPVEAPPLPGQKGANITAPDIHSRPAGPPTSGVAKEATPPSTGVEAPNYPRYAKWPAVGEAARRGEPEPQPHTVVGEGLFAQAEGVQPQAAKGINVVQPGHGDPTLQHTFSFDQPAPTPKPVQKTFEPPRPPDGTHPPPAPEPIPRERSLVPSPQTTQGVTETPVQAGHTRMYKGDPRSATDFTTDRKTAESYGQPVRHVDVPEAQARAQFTPREGPGSNFTANKIWEAPNYQARLRPTEEVRTPQTTPRPPEPPPIAEPPTKGGPTEPPSGGTPPAGTQVAPPALETKLAAQAAAEKPPAPPPPAAPPIPPAGAAPAAQAVGKEMVWKTKAGNKKVRVSPVPHPKEGYVNITYGKNGKAAVPANQLHEPPPPKGQKAAAPAAPEPPPTAPPPAAPAAAAPAAAKPTTISVRVNGVNHTLTSLHQTTFGQILSQHPPRPGMIGKLMDFIQGEVRRQIGNMPVHFVSPKDMIKSGGSHNSAFYDPLNHRIVVSQAALADKTQMAHAIIHEGIHGVTSAALLTNHRVRSAVQLLMADVKQAEMLQTAKAGGTKLDPRLNYGLNINEREFLAEAFSNPRFQKMLTDHVISKQTAAALDHYLGTQPKSAWQGLVETVRNLLKIPADKVSALEAAMRATEKAASINEAASKGIQESQGRKYAENKYSVDPSPPSGKATVTARDKFGNEVKFVGETVHAAAAKARKNKYSEILNEDGTPYREPKAAAAEATQTGAKAAQTDAAPTQGSATKPPSAPAPLGGTPLAAATEPKRLQGFRDAVTKIVDSYKRTFDPARISEGALKGQAPARSSRAFFEGEKTRITKAGEAAEKMWNKVPEAERLKALDDYENGRKTDPKYQAYFNERFGPESKRAHKEEVQLGSKASYIEDYVAHEWNRPKGNQPSISEHFKSMGATWFQKARTIDIINEGYKAGYTLKNTNPEVLLRSRLIAGADMRAKMELLHDWRDMKLAGQAAEGTSKGLKRMGWQEYNAPDRTKWMISPEVATIWKNGIEAKGLWQMENLAGDAFRGWMAFKAVWVPLKLAASAFHALHVVHINFSSDIARAVSQATSGNLTGAADSIAKSIIPYRPSGTMGRAQWALPEHMRSADGKQAVRLMEEGGFVPMINEEMRIDAGKAFAKAVSDMNVFKIPIHGLRLAIQKVQAPLFEHWIPHLKTAAYLNDVAAHLQAHPELMGDVVNRRVALTEIAKSVDNRFGEMFYGGLFWNRYVKDASIGSFLSLGWNLGFAREFLGAGIETVSRPAQKFIPGLEAHATRKVAQDATNKIAFASVYMSTAMAIGGMITLALTGKPPEEINDYIFPRVGGTNPDGSPRRLTTMFYTREIPMLMKHVQEHGGGVGGAVAGTMDMVWNKMLFQPFKELYDNRSYFGKEIFDTNAAGYEKLMQAGKHVFGEQFSPMSVTGAKRSQETGGSAKEVPLAFLGFGPAPGYAEKSAMQNRIGALYKEHVAPGARAYEDEANTKAKLKARNDILMAKQSGDRSALVTAIKDGYKAGLKGPYIDSIMKNEFGDQKMFKQLPVTDQTHLLGRATPEEVKRYLPFAKKETQQLWYKEHPYNAAR